MKSISNNSSILFRVSVFWHAVPQTDAAEGANRATRKSKAAAAERKNAKEREAEKEGDEEEQVEEVRRDYGFRPALLWPPLPRWPRI